jgi:hypothetical protein
MSQGIPASEILGILSTFSGVPEVCTYRAPHLFLRAHGRASTKPVYAPNYWADGSALASSYNRAAQFKGFLTDSEISSIAKNYYREITAISHNWNDLAPDSFWRITLRGSETVEGLEGPAARQPTHSANKRTGETASQAILSGGALQVFLNPKTPFICTPVNW